MKRSLFFLLALALVVSARSQSNPQPQPKQQSQPPPYASDTVLRATTRLVVVDVVVTDAQNAHVADLTEDDFSVTEDGVTQKVIDFSMHKPGTTSARAVSNVVTNSPGY